MVFPRARVAVFLDGCFRHGCPEHLRPAKLNEGFWSTKIAGNRLRDQDTDRQLGQAGWTIVHVWEHEESRLTADRVAAAVRGRQVTPLSEDRSSG
jgi:DNA mismatch endonuclease (patch repair protein)